VTQASQQAIQHFTLIFSTILKPQLDATLKFQANYLPRLLASLSSARRFPSLLCNGEKWWRTASSSPCYRAAALLITPGTRSRLRELGRQGGSDAAGRRLPPTRRKNLPRGASRTRACSAAPPSWRRPRSFCGARGRASGSSASSCWRTSWPGP
jgi:hypothetical protein